MARNYRKAAASALAGVFGFLVFAVASGFFPEADLPIFVGAGMVFFVFCCARALSCCGVDDIVFDDAMRRGRYVPPQVTDASRRRKISGFAAVAPFPSRYVEKQP